MQNGSESGWMCAVRWVCALSTSQSLCRITIWSHHELLTVMFHSHRELEALPACGANASTDRHGDVPPGSLASLLRLRRETRPEQRQRETGKRRSAVKEMPQKHEGGRDSRRLPRGAGGGWGGRGKEDTGL